MTHDAIIVKKEVYAKEFPKLHCNNYLYMYIVHHYISIISPYLLLIWSAHLRSSKKPFSYFCFTYDGIIKRGSEMVGVFYIFHATTGCLAYRY